MIELKSVCIGDLGRIITGKTPPSERQELFGDHYPFLTPTDIDGVARYVNPGRYLSNQGYQFQPRLIIPEHTVCVVCIGATIGKVCVASRPSFTNQQINSIVVDDNIHDPSFVYYLLTTLREELKSNAGGAATPIINKTTFSNIRVDVPPLPIQRRIAGILSAYDDLIENNRKRIAILDEMARRLFREWFVHFRYPGHESVPLVDSPLGRIPQGWEVQRVDSICKGVLDGDWIETKDQGGNDYRLLQISNIGLGDFVETGNFRYVTKATFDRLRCTEIQPDDLLIARMPTPIGRAWLAKRMPWRMITAVDVAIVKPDPRIVDPVYLLYFWNQPATLALIEKQSTGTTRLRITRRELCALLVPTPVREVQGLFAQQVRPMLDLANNLRDQNDVLRRTRDLLLPRLMSGRLSVTSAEAAVP
jgi:type I restriction enzyme S subunit